MLLVPALVTTLALSALDGPSYDARDEQRPNALQHEQSDDRIDDLVPEVLVYGHLYDGRFLTVSSVYCDPVSGEIYVADAGRNAVGIFTDKGSPIFTFTDPEHLHEPRKVLVDRQGRILVIDDDLTRIKVFSYRGEFLSYLELPWPTGLAPQDLRLTAMALDPDGDLYVGNSGTGEVFAFDPTLKKVKARIGYKGKGKGLLSTIVGIAADADFLYVADAESLGVQVFTKYGRFLRGWGYHDGGTHNVSLPQGIAVDAKGRIVLVDALRQEIKYFDPQGRMIERFGGIGSEPGQVAYPSDVSIDRRGRLCIADKGNGRVQVLSVVDGAKPVVPDGAAAPRTAPR